MITVTYMYIAYLDVCYHRLIITEFRFNKWDQTNAVLPCRRVKRKCVEMWHKCTTSTSVTYHVYACFIKRLRHSRKTSRNTLSIDKPIRAWRVTNYFERCIKTRPVNYFYSNSVSAQPVQTHRWNSRSEVERKKEKPNGN